MAQESVIVTLLLLFFRPEIVHLSLFGKTVIRVITSRVVSLKLRANLVQSHVSLRRILTLDTGWDNILPTLGEGPAHALSVRL